MTGPSGRTGQLPPKLAVIARLAAEHWRLSDLRLLTVRSGTPETDYAHRTVHDILTSVLRDSGVGRDANHALAEVKQALKRMYFDTQGFHAVAEVYAGAYLAVCCILGDVTPLQ